MFAYTSALVDRAKAELALVKADRKGVTALEYGIMAGLIAGVIVVAVTAIGTDLNGVFNKLSDSLSAVPGA